MQCSGTFRLEMELRAVKVNADRKGEIVTLAPGSLVIVSGASKIAGLVEIVCHGEPLSAFAEDVIERGVPIKQPQSEPQQRRADLWKIKNTG